jgi:hypothetical protein
MFLPAKKAGPKRKAPAAQAPLFTAISPPGTERIVLTQDGRMVLHSDLVRTQVAIRITATQTCALTPSPAYTGLLANSLTTEARQQLVATAPRVSEKDPDLDLPSDLSLFVPVVVSSKNITLEVLTILDDVETVVSTSHLSDSSSAPLDDHMYTGPAYEQDGVEYRDAHTVPGLNGEEDGATEVLDRLLSRVISVANTQAKIAKVAQLRAEDPEDPDIGPLEEALRKRPLQRDVDSIAAYKESLSTLPAIQVDDAPQVLESFAQLDALLPGIDWRNCTPGCNFLDAIKKTVDQVNAWRDEAREAERLAALEADSLGSDE